jgi:hypothetical protein
MSSKPEKGMGGQKPDRQKDQSEQSQQNLGRGGQQNTPSQNPMKDNRESGGNKNR